MWNGKKMDECKSGISMFSHIQFSCMSDPLDSGQDSYNFGAIENIPNSIKYDFNSDTIKFRLAPGHETYIQLSIDLLAVYQCIDYKDRFYLNPVKWDLVKRDLSEGWCYCPWVYIDDKSGCPELMDGRHRMAALMKFTNYKEVPFVVSPEDLTKVTNYFHGDKNMCIYREKK